MFDWDFKLMLGQDSEDEIWTRFVLELVMWPKQVTLVSWTQPSGPLCLWQYLHPVSPLACPIFCCWSQFWSSRHQSEFRLVSIFKGMVKIQEGAFPSGPPNLKGSCWLSDRPLHRNQIREIPWRCVDSWSQGQLIETYVSVLPKNVSFFGDIEQKSDLVVTFDRRVLLTQGQQVFQKARTRDKFNRHK